MNTPIGRNPAIAAGKANSDGARAPDPVAQRERTIRREPSWWEKFLSMIGFRAASGSASKPTPEPQRVSERTTAR
jgi:hypothetical protein